MNLRSLQAVNSVDDFCLFAPPEPGPGSTIGNTERIEVAWCIKPGYGTRLIPDGAITGAHFVQTPDYVQVTGVGNLTALNIAAVDAGGGGELDPHGADGNGALVSCSVLRVSSNMRFQATPLADSSSLARSAVRYSSCMNGQTSWPLMSSAFVAARMALERPHYASTSTTF